MPAVRRVERLALQRGAGTLLGFSVATSTPHSGGRRDTTTAVSGLKGGTIHTRPLSNQLSTRQARQAVRGAVGTAQQADAADEAQGGTRTAR